MTSASREGATRDIIGDVIRAIEALGDAVADSSKRRDVVSRALEECPGADARGEFLTALKNRSERFLSLEPRTSLVLAEALIDAVHLTGDLPHLAYGYLAEADARRFLGDLPRAYALYERAGETFMAMGNEVGWARSRIGWLSAAHGLGRGEPALGAVERARDVLVRHQEWLRAGALSLNAGALCFELGQLDRAAEHYSRAISFYERAATDPDSRGSAEVRIAKAKTNRAMILARQGEFHAATALHDEASAIFQRHGETIPAVLSDRYVADILADQGRYTGALGRYQAALDALEEVALEVDAAQVLLSAAECHLGLNRPASALDLVQRALDRLEERGATTEAARARYHRAIVRAQLNQIEAAFADLAEVAVIFDRAGLAADVAVARLQRARLYLEEERWPDAAAEAAGARAIFHDRGMAVREAQCSLVQAEAAWRLDQVALAARHAEAVLAAAQRSELSSFSHGARLILARIARRQGDLVDALASYEAAMTDLDRVQGFLATELRAEFLADKLPVYEEAIDLCLSLGQNRRAFIDLERAKSRALVDYLLGHPDIQARAPDAATHALLDQIETARAEHHALYRRLQGDHLAARAAPEVTDPGRRAVESAGPDEVEHLRHLIQQREASIGELLDRLSLAHPNGFERPAPPPDDLLAPPRQDDDAALIEYFVRPDGAVAFVVTAEDLDVVRLPARTGDIARYLSRWQLNLDAATAAVANGDSLAPLAANARGILAALYRALILPLEPHLVGKRVLTAVPYGPLHRVPFHALFDGERFLLETREVAVCPSSSLLHLVGARAAHAASSALILGHDHRGRLPGAVVEARAVAELLAGECFLEDRATRQAVREADSRHSILHIACHGAARLDNPTFAHLELADGFLGMTDIFNLHLEGALVTLSACETGRGVVTSGDEVVGLGRGFLFAGASTIIQSLWRVDDEATTLLMKDFYRSLISGQSKGAALREAQQQALARHPEHPCRWAAFQLIGHRGHLAINTTGRHGTL